MKFNEHVSKILNLESINDLIIRNKEIEVKQLLFRICENHTVSTHNINKNFAENFDTLNAGNICF